MSEAQKTSVDSAISVLPDAFVAIAGPKLLKFFEDHYRSKDDPLLTCKEAGDLVGLSDTTIRHLVSIGRIHRAPDLAEIRIKRSVLDQYGKPERTK